MTDDEWEKQRMRAVMAAFQTGRPVFGNTEGELRYADGSEECVEDHVGVLEMPEAAVKLSWWGRLTRRFKKDTRCG